MDELELEFAAGKEPTVDIGFIYAQGPENKQSKKKAAGLNVFIVCQG